MPLHSIEQIGFASSGGQVKLGIECINSKEVPVYAAWRTGATIADSAEITGTLLGSIGQSGALGDALGQLFSIGGQIEQYPVDEGADGRIWVIAYKGNTFCAFRHRIPL